MNTNYSRLLENCHFWLLKHCFCSFSNIISGFANTVPLLFLVSWTQQFLVGPGTLLFRIIVHSNFQSLEHYYFWCLEKSNLWSLFDPETVRTRTGSGSKPARILHLILLKRLITSKGRRSAIILIIHFIYHICFFGIYSLGDWNKHLKLPINLSNNLALKMFIFGFVFAMVYPYGDTACRISHKNCKLSLEILLTISIFLRRLVSGVSKLEHGLHCRDVKLFDDDGRFRRCGEILFGLQEVLI